MIPRSIWRWMILDIKRKKKEKRIQLLGGLMGICVAVVSLFYFFHAEKAEAEKRMVEIVNYVKVQCSTYTHYNESSESKSLLRAIESARQMSTNINMEIRLKNERAYYAVRDLLTYHDAERTAFDIINRYMRFADKEVEKRRSEWQTNEKWAYFIGSDRGRLKLTTKPEPYTLTRTLNWISRQVAPTWKVLQKIDSTNGTTYLKDILDHAKLTERHKKLIEQQTTSTEEMITETEE